MLRYSDKLAHKVAEVQRASKHIRLVTLTGRYYPTLEESFSHVQVAFSKLRRHKSWSDYVDGGGVSFEITACGEGFRTHLHGLIEGRYFPQEELVSEWHSVTGDEYVVDIRYVSGGGRGAALEVCKYPFKPSDVASWTDGQKQEFNDFLKGRRLFTTFGTWYGESMISRYKFSCPYCKSENLFWDFEVESIRERLYPEPFSYPSPASALDLYGIFS